MGLGSTKDDVVGQVKETAGGALGDEQLRREGQLEQTRGELRRQAESMHDHAQQAKQAMSRRFTDAVHRRTSPRS